MNKVKKNPHYVNNKDFHDALINYKIKVNQAKEKGSKSDYSQLSW